MLVLVRYFFAHNFFTKVNFFRDQSQDMSSKWFPAKLLMNFLFLKGHFKFPHFFSLFDNDISSLKG